MIAQTTTATTSHRRDLSAAPKKRKNTPKPSLYAPLPKFAVSYTYRHDHGEDTRVASVSAAKRPSQPPLCPVCGERMKPDERVVQNVLPFPGLPVAQYTLELEAV